jgi:hypothetical protein
MRPTPFVFEIPERPIYEPGSGPAMAPIALQPDDTDTGWVIADTVDFQGVSQYIVTPADNSAHRRPVRKEHILDWVSPKAYEDFEYEQYKKQAEEEWERDNKILAKATAIKGRRHGMAVARERAKARMSFSGYMQLEPAIQASTSEHLSSLGDSQDEVTMKVISEHKESTKRKRSAGFSQDQKQAVNRRGVGSLTSLSLSRDHSPAKPSQTQHLYMMENENEVRDKDEQGPNSVGAEPKRPARFETPILPPQRIPQTFRNDSTPGKTHVSPYSLPGKTSFPTSSPERPTPKPKWSFVGHLSSSFESPGLTGPKNTARVMSPKNAITRLQNGRGRDYTPILPPPSFPRPSVSRATSTVSENAVNGTGSSSKRGTLKHRFQSLSTTDESPSDTENLEALGASITGETKVPHGKSIMNGLGPSKITSGRGKGASSASGTQKGKNKKGSKSSSSRSSAVLKRPNKSKSHASKGSTKKRGPTVSKEQSEYFANMMMKEETKDDTEEAEEEDDEEAWDIHGILDDEFRPVDGYMVRHYLCEWVGDYDPTWEPEENVSVEAVKAYEKKIKRESSLGFDGAMDIETNSQNGGNRNLKTFGRFNEIFAQENGNEGSDSEVFTDAFTDAAAFLTPDRKPQSGANSITGESEESGMFVRAVTS